LLTTAFIVVHPLSYLAAYTQRELDRDRTNQRYFELLEQIGKARGERSILLDASLREAETPGGGTAYKTLSLALALDQVPYRLSDLGAAEPPGSTDRCQDQLAVFWVGWESSGRSPEQLRRIADRLNLRELDGDRVGRLRGGNFYTFRLDRAQPPTMPCG
jgi:hypothetical protein